jgi:glycosyltransferase involved in cell wall biosynthesis
MTRPVPESAMAGVDGPRPEEGDAGTAWVRAFHARAGRPPRILHFGNIANNAYNNTKILRRHGIDASTLVCNYRHIMGQPEWEDAVIDEPVDEFAPDWQKVDLHGFSRPAWFIQETWRRFPVGQGRLFRGLWRLRSYAERLRQTPEALRIAAALSPGMTAYRGLSGEALLLSDILRLIDRGALFRRLLAGYDLIQAYGPDPIFSLLFAGSTPWIAFEHGTLRELPFAPTPQGRLLSLAYQRARKIIITTPDVVRSARRLGVANYLFIPHPIDEQKYAPGATTLRDKLLQELGASALLFAPSRHNFPIKGNDRMLRAFATICRDTTSRPILLLCDWGQECRQSRELIAELGIDRRVVWLPPLCKTKLIDYYRAADVVLDQFVIGTFGTVTPEAMACAKPVLVHFDDELHRWCYESMPPVVRAQTDADIVAKLRELLASTALRQQIGAASRSWVERWHSSRVVAERHLRVYAEILGP